MRLVPVPNVVGLELDGESYVHVPGSSDLVLLDEVGGHVWALLQEGSSPEEAANLVAEAYRQPAERVRPDVAAFVERLVAAGLLVPA